LTYDPANKTLGVDVTASGLVAGSDHAVHIHLGSCDSQRVFENRQVRASRLVMVVIMARWTMASWWSGLVS
jgi:hypothetical protein